MTATPETEAGVSRLAAALAEKFRLEKAENVAQLFKAGRSRPAFLQPMRARMAEFYDLHAPLAIYDPAGTLALVEWISPDEKNLETGVRKAIAQAAAVRQILLERAERESRGGAEPARRRFAMQVELLLVGGPPGSQAESALSAVLTTVVRETGYLRLIGVGVLQPDSLGGFSDSALRRAFPWLLRATRRWFGGKEFRRPARAWRNDGEFAEVRTLDYRTPGERRFRCDPGCNLQLVHGHNGSGKSALAEALELLLTGRVERLEEGGGQDYFLAVRHRPAGVDDEALRQRPAAEASLWTGSATSPLLGVRLLSDGTRDPFGTETPEPMKVHSFRLDQVFMDKLLRSRPGGRAELFLDAFSPGDKDLLPRLIEHRNTLQQAASWMPQHAATAAPTDETQLVEWVLREFGWLYPDPAATAASGTPQAGGLVIEAMLAAPLNELRLLAKLSAGWSSVIASVAEARDREALSKALGAMDNALVSLLPLVQESLIPLRTALRVFEEFRSWRARGRVARGAGFKADLDRWLEAQALLDLISRSLEIQGTVEKAREQGWSADSRDSSLLRAGAPSQSDVSALTARKAELAEEVREARARLAAWQEEGAPGAEEQEAAPGTPIRDRLSPTEVEHLNRVGHWLESTRGRQPLGAAFEQALKDEKSKSIGKSVIGRPGGLDAAIAEVRELISACERLNQPVTGPASSGTVRLQKAEALLQAARTIQTLSRDLPKSFFQRLAGGEDEVLKDLIAAFNELLALMTPARWTYRDVILEPQIGNAQASAAPGLGPAPSLGMSTVEGARADLLFNTAELNSSALALFLLLAPRLPNRLRLLVLDDPLQNMDEMTVITVARALARLLRVGVYARGWHVLALFHGEEDVDRIRQEASSVVFHLPWLQPSSGNGQDPVPSIEELSTWPADLQTVAGIFVDRGPSQAG